MFAAALLAAWGCGGGDGDDEPRPDARVADTADAAIAPDAPAPPVPDAAPPADAPPPDAAVPDVLFAFLNGSLYRIDPDTAALTVVGETGLGVASLADAEWDASAGVARVVVSAFTAPSLATVDLCTGAITTGPRLSHEGLDLIVSEGFTIDPATGTLYASIDGDRGGSFLSELAATLDPATGAATSLGAVDTLQDDLDQLAWADGTLVGLDVLVGTGAQLYDVNTTTGATALRANVAEQVNRIAYDVARSRLVATTARETPRRLVEIDLTTGALTTIGTTHTDAEHGGATIDAIFVAPAPTCP